MTRKPMYKRVVEKWTNQKGEQHERVTPKRHSKKYIKYREKKF